MTDRASETAVIAIWGCGDRTQKEHEQQKTKGAHVHGPGARLFCGPGFSSAQAPLGMGPAVLGGLGHESIRQSIQRVGGPVHEQIR